MVFLIIAGALACVAVGFVTGTAFAARYEIRQAEFRARLAREQRVHRIESWTVAAPSSGER